MTNPEIRVGANLDDANKAVDEFGQKLIEASKPVEVDVNTAAAGKAIDALAEKVEALGEAQPALPTTGVSALAKELERARRIQTVLAKEGIKASEQQAKAARDAFAKWRDSGARGTRRLKGQELEDYLDGGWRKTALSEVDAKRSRAEVLRAIGVGTGAGAGAGNLLGQLIHDAVLSTGRAAGRRVFPHGGVGGQIVQQGMDGAAAGGGAGMLLAGGLMGAAAFGVLKLVGGIAGRIGGANERAIEQSDVARTLGLANDELERLRTSAHDLANGLGMVADESTRLLKGYGQASGLPGNDLQQLTREAFQAGSFARQTGMDPNAAAAAFGSMRRNGQESPERVGKAIADAMSRRGDFGRLGEVVQAMEGFSRDVAGSSRLAANTGLALDLAGRLAGLKLPGLGTPEGVGNVAALDAGFRGGAGGEAGDMMLLGGLQRQGLGVTGYDVASVREAGLMANLKDVFGKGSTGYKAAEARGDQQEMDRLSGIAEKASGTVLDLVMSQIRGRYGSLQEQASALRGVTSGSQNDVQAFIAGLEGGPVETVLAKLRAKGIDTEKMSAQQIVQAGGAMGLSDEGLRGRREALLARRGSDALSAEDRKALEGAATSEELRDALMRFAAKDTIKTEGEKVREGQAALKDAVDGMAERVAALLTPIRDVLVDMAKFFKVIDGDAARKLKGKSELDEARDRLADLRQERANPNNSRGRNKALDAQIESAERREKFLAGEDASEQRTKGATSVVGASREDAAKRIEAMGGERATLVAERDSLRQQAAEAREEAKKAAGRFGTPDYTKAQALEAAAGKRNDRIGEVDASVKALEKIANGQVAPADEASDRRERKVAQLAAAPSPYDAIFEAAAKQHGVEVSDLKLLAARESGMQAGAKGKPNADGSTDLGIMQHNSRYLAERGLTPETALDPSKAIPAGAKLWADLLKRNGGNKQAAFKAYNGRGPQAEAYGSSMARSRAILDGLVAPEVPKVASRDRLPDDPVPAQTPVPRESLLQHQVSVVLRDPRGGTLAEAPPVRLHDGRPRAAGVESNWAAS